MAGPPRGSVDIDLDLGEAEPAQSTYPLCVRIGLLAAVSLALSGVAHAERASEAAATSAEPSAEPVPRPPIITYGGAPTHPTADSVPRPPADPTAEPVPRPPAGPRSPLDAAAQPAWRPNAHRLGVTLPPALRVDVQFALARFDPSDMAFSDPNGPLQLRGEAMRLDAGVGFGAGFSVGVVGPNGGASFNFLYFAPDDSGAVALGAPLRGLHVARWTLEAGFMRRFGDITPFFLVEGGILRATADLQEPFVTIHAHRFTLGPRVGLRAFLFKTLYVQLAYFMDMLAFPDHVLALGLGLGRR